MVFHNQIFSARDRSNGGAPQKWGGPVHLHTLHIPKAATVPGKIK